ncbi:MAG TPA: hypothetical protein VHS99_07100, partial [Chloroflexota bacterium]|nr:hypothetical protein [Chloroflexota bacterium]
MFHGNVRLTGNRLMGAVFALDDQGQAIAHFDPTALQVTLDGQPLRATWLGERPKISLIVAFLLSPSASDTVRRALAQAVKDRLAGLDLR